MKVSGIDKQIVELIDFMNEKEMKPFASCDGVLEEHVERYTKIYGDDFEKLLKERPEMILCGYVSFMDNEYTKELLANALDNDLIVDFMTVKEDEKVYDNIVSGKIFAIRFPNLNGENTELVYKVVRETYNKTMIPSERNLKLVQEIIEAIPNIKMKYFAQITLNSTKNYNIAQDNFGKHASIFIMNNKNFQIDGKEFADYFNKEYGIKIWCNDDSKNEGEIERNYAFYRTDRKSYFFSILRDEYIEKIPEILKNMFEHEFTITKKEQ